jgi:hypothetical protein
MIKYEALKKRSLNQLKRLKSGDQCSLILYRAKLDEAGFNKMIDEINEVYPVKVVLQHVPVGCIVEKL